MTPTLIKSLPRVRGSYRENVDLANTTWFRVGGPAEIIYKPEDQDDLSYFIQNLAPDIHFNILGLCSNVIVRDHGIPGVTIKLGRNFTDTKIEENFVTIGCANTDYNTARFLADNSLSGLEFLIGIPGSIGGAIAMNAGCYGSEISDHLISVQGINKKNGKIYTLSKQDLAFKYRTCGLREEFIFTSASFKLQKLQNQDRIKEKIEEITKSRTISQPIRERTGGSTFKNPDGKKAWELIDQAGLRGYRIGGAQVSEKHCNFLINTGDATAADIEDLGNFIQNKVKEKTGILLEWEIIRIGTR